MPRPILRVLPTGQREGPCVGNGKGHWARRRSHWHRAQRVPGTCGCIGSPAAPRLATGASTRLGGGDLLIGGEANIYNGPWSIGENLKKYSALSPYSWDRGSSQFSLLGMAYTNRWRATDQIPLRAVNDGRIQRLGQIDSTDGGDTQRYSLSASWRRAGRNAVQEAQLFGIHSDLSLFSNFTYFLDHSSSGDQFNQREHRMVVGGSVRHVQDVQAMGVRNALTLGLQTRVDFLRPVGLYRTQERARGARCVRTS